MVAGMTRLRALFLSVAALLVASSPVLADPPAPPSEASRQFAQVLDEYQRWRDVAFPESAIQLGRPTTADRITDPSLRGIEMRHAQVKDFLAQLRAIDAAALTADEQLNLALLSRDLQESVDGHRFRAFLMPVSGRGGPQQDIPQMAENMPFGTDEDYSNYIKRLTAVPQAIRDTRMLMELGIKEGRMPPKATMQDLPAQFEAVINSQLEALRAPLARMPASIPPERQAELRAELNQWIPPILEALVEMRGFLITTYLPACRDTVAARALPDGAAWYDFALRTHTTTSLTAREIHELGLAEVARIRAEMMQVIRRTDWYAADTARAKLPEDQLFAAFLAYLRTDPRFYTTSEEELLSRYRDICKQIDAQLPALFGTLPRNPYGVRAIPRFMAPTQTTAYYQPGSLRAGNPGWFYANTYALDQRPTYEMIPLSLHEAVPGHHLQVSIAQELPDQPEFRRQLGVTAFVEGWALYAERLGIEMGFFQGDPYADFGRLLYEMWRATRLVVDTGIHAFDWPRDKAIEYMKANTALSELNIMREVDRYIDWPGQATGYKIGELRIRALRERAERELGKAFDVRAFHDALLGAGAIPLDVLEQRMDAWIRARAAAAAATPTPASP
jgi:uncharacterized protein (DUF885 family)